MTRSLCCTAETDNTVNQLYSNKKEKKKKKKKPWEKWTRNGS